MNDFDILRHWLAVFGRGVGRQALEEHVLSSGNHLWHLFSWKLTPCLEGDEARAAFNGRPFTEAIRFNRSGNALLS